MAGERLFRPIIGYSFTQLRDPGARGSTSLPAPKSRRVSINIQRSWAGFTDRRVFRVDLPPIAHEDFMEIGVESQLIPFVVSAILRVEQSPNDSPRLTLAEVECLIEILDKVRSPMETYPSELDPR